MRKLVSFHFMSLDGVVEAPDQFVRADQFDDFPELIGLTIAEQDAVVLGRTMYEEWAGYWPGSKIAPFSAFINDTPKFVFSGTLQAVQWNRSTLRRGELSDEISRLKNQPGKAIGVHGSISLTQSLLSAGLLDELRFIQVPVIAGSGRRLVEQGGASVQLDLQSARTLRSGLQYLVYVPRQ